MHESELENGLYHADNVRAHASYMLYAVFYHKEKHLTFVHNLYEIYFVYLTYRKH